MKYSESHLIKYKIFRKQAKKVSMVTIKHYWFIIVVSLKMPALK